MKRTLTVLLLIAALLCTVAVAVCADFGSFSSDADFDYDWDDDWDSDWDSDWDDDSDWSWDDDSDWSWDDDSDWSWDDDDDWDDDDWSWSSSGSSYGSGYGGSSAAIRTNGGSAILDAVFLLAIAVLILRARNKKKNGRSNSEGRMRSRSGSGTIPGVQKFEAPKLRPMEEYTALDPSFSEDALKERCANLYVQMQNCWTAKDLSPLEPYFTDAFLNQMRRQLDGLCRSGRTNYVENICVLGVELIGFNQQGGNDHIFARVTARITDYTLNDADGSLVAGDRSAQKVLTYEWNLVRACGQTTRAGAGSVTVNCPNCGAPLDVNASAQCPYCGSILQRPASDWALCGIRGLRQQTR